MTTKIPATVVTGFLGAGKTSLIQHLLRTANGRRLALIINEFGDIGVDGEILKGCQIQGCEEENLIELANGCICCTVADDFIPTMEKLLARSVRTDHILIETSGLALPKPLLKAFDWPEIRSRITVDGVIALQKLCHGRNEIVGNGAADAAIGKLDDVVLGAVFRTAALQHVAIDAEIAEFVDDQRYLLSAGVGK